MNDHKPSVLIVDDHTLVRDALSQVLRAHQRFSSVRVAANANEAIDQAVLDPPEVVVFDIDMPGLSAFEACAKIRELKPSVRMMFLSAHCTDHNVERGLRAGASGFLTKGEPPDRVTEAIIAVAEGRTWFSAEVRERLVVGEQGLQLESQSEAKLTRNNLLTGRETEVLGYLARGYSKKQIANIISLSVKTVDNHTTNIMKKLDIHDRVQLARYAIREGLIPV